MIATNISFDTGAFVSAQTNFPWVWQISGKRLAAVQGKDAEMKATVEISTVRKTFIVAALIAT